MLNLLENSNFPLLGIHLLVHDNTEITSFCTEIPVLAKLGVNLIITEINYHFEFTAHPELRASSVITRDHIQRLHQICSDSGIKLIPQFQCLGHQSWAESTFPLLLAYPDFDETPGKYPLNEGIYCRSWCPQHPDVNPIVFNLIDELLDAFQSQSIHVGMDEVFLIGSEHCPRCAGRDPAELFSQAVKDLYSHIVSHKGGEMLMWGDRLLNAETTGYGEWEAADNGTHPAIDWIPKDIVICDWHYEQRESYPSIPIFLDKGFHVLPSGWHDVTASEGLWEYALTMNQPQMLGYLCTTWGKIKPGEIAQFPALKAISQKFMASRPGI